MQRVHRRYLREFLPAMLGYVLVLFAATLALRHVEHAALRILLALAPVVPIGFAARAMLRFVRDVDELQRKIELEALALAALVLTAGSFALGLLVSARVLSVSGQVVLIWILPGYMLLYGVFKCVSARRYR
ncbi:hypothetical protein LDO26_12745 [Luteimonas sp. BDR2-5]|uniref:hypothetical protein n=1 Tax=Proluteimonas luteida TaxID=2878685 RepID=UPI001E2E62C7|nr:hypothetical protein [Luteimonas sp. BDR2-5]MCD9029069.1 hypothetical protein [Luteimonas sp. BDR2-5]